MQGYWWKLVSSACREEAYLTSESGQDEIASGSSEPCSRIVSGKESRYTELRLSYPNHQNGEGSASNTGAGNAVLTNSQGNTTAVQSGPGAQTVLYAVQLRSSDKQLSLRDPVFAGLSGVSEYLQQGSYKYYVGNHATFDDALKHQNTLRKTGFKDAFVIAMRNGKRITL
jgi:hypothetical protein